MQIGWPDRRVNKNLNLENYLSEQILEYTGLEHRQTLRACDFHYDLQIEKKILTNKIFEILKKNLKFGKIFKNWKKVGNFDKILKFVKKFESENLKKKLEI